MRRSPALPLWSFLVLTAVFASACDRGPKGHVREKGEGLSIEEAEFRASHVSDVRYALRLEVEKTADATDFSGTVDAFFKLKAPVAGLTLDFKGGGTVVSMEVNGTAVSAPETTETFIYLPAESLKAGENAVKIAYTHPYSKDGQGLYRFKDPEDKRVYLYSDFEPHSANALFPCFDQPDLKAAYTLTAEAPASWTVISSTHEASTEDLPAQGGGEARKLWKFPETPRFSTYIFSFHAGPYKMWTAEEPAQTPDGTAIPLRLFARQSLARYVNSEDWFNFTRQGMGFYQEFFGTPYPFGKYDQVIVPDFNYGAMENVAAVLFAERFVKRGNSTQEDRENLAETLLHEMAHMWFGDLVTMKWWDDLWLNESFATYMSYLAVVEATEFKDMWRRFYTDTKQWAYWEDQLVTTHPIVTEVPHTAQALANFDGITYGKGASVLKQLSFLLGANRFRDGVRSYFKKYAFKNATMSDFMESLSQTAGMPLGPWTQNWLRTSGLNTLGTEFQCADGKIKKLTLTQKGADDHPTLREHRTQVGLYSKDGDHVVLRRAHQVTYRGENTQVPHLVGLECPLLVYPNHGDFDFAKVRLDPATVKAMRTELGFVEDSMVRMMFWQSLWDMVRDAEMAPSEFAEMAFTLLPSETDLVINREVTLHLPDVLHYLPHGAVEDRVRLDAFVEKTERFLWDRLAAAAGGSDLQKLWFDRFSQFAQSADGVTKMAGLLDGRLRVRSLEFDQDRRWTLVRRIQEFDPAKGKPLLAKEQQRDPSENGAKAVVAVQAVEPDLKIKTEWFDKIIAEKSDLPLARLRTAAENLFPRSQGELSEQLASRFFEEAGKVNATKDDFYLEAYGLLVPANCTEKSVDRTRKYLASAKDLKPMLLKSMRVSLQEDERCVNIRKAQTAKVPTAETPTT